MQLLSKEGAEVKILSFDREYYSGKLFFEDYISLGSIEHGNYLKRLLPFLKSLRTIRTNIKNSDVIYCFGLDTFLLGWLASKFISSSPKLVYEVGDIRKILTKDKLMSKILRVIQKFLTRKADLLAVTSEDYVTGYFENMLGLSDLNYKVMENKIAKNEMPVYQNDKKITDENILKIGYFGVLRCPKSWEILKKIAIQSKGKIEIVLRGIPRGIKDFYETLEKVPNIIYNGEYKSPDDLPEMYTNVDLVWACYPYQREEVGNWRWARTTRFYEACYFKRPLITQDNTADSRVVEEYNIGATVSLERTEETANRVLNISTEEIQKWYNNLYELPEEICVYTDEHRQLYERLK
ncbi:MAG: hypothetical protein ACOCZT_02380 [Halanaerobiales bacterium]